MSHQVNPERDKISHFGENEFISQNLNFYRKKLWREDPKAQVHLRVSGSGLLPTTGFRQQCARRVRTFAHLAVRLLSTHCFCAAALVLPVVLSRYTLPVTSSVTLSVLFYLLDCSFGLDLVRHVSPFTSWGTSLRTIIFRGRIFHFPRACGLLPLPLHGHGTCYWVHRG